MTETKSKQTAETKGWWRKVCIVPGRLDGKIAVVTGANTGIGAVTTAQLARRGCVVIMGCRSLDRANAAKEDILSKFGDANPDSLKTDIADPSVVSSLSTVKPDQLIVELIDLASLESVRQFAERVLKAHPKLNYLVNNAGLILTNYETSVDGFEKTIAINHLGPFLLTELLLPALKQGSPSRIINVSSYAHTWGSLRKPDLEIPKSEYKPFAAYSQSKLANVMHARELSKRLSGTGVVTASLHPGVVKSDFYRDFNTFHMKVKYTLAKPFEIDNWLGAQTTLFTLLTNKLESGGYYDNCALKCPHRNALKDADCKWLWEKSSELVGLKSSASI